MTIVEAAERILPALDRELSQSAAQVLKKRGVAIHAAARVSRIEPGSPLTLAVETKTGPLALPIDGVLIAAGRRPNTEGLFAPGLDVLAPNGAIKVNAHMETPLPGVYAAGDAADGSVCLAHAASAAAINAIHHMLGSEPPADLALIPSCIYMEPEIACVGLTADQAKAAGTPVKTGKASMTANGKALIETDERGFIKLVFHAETDILLGAQLFCPRATDLVSELTSAAGRRLTLDQLAAAVRPHPTFSEAVTEAAEAANRRAIHIAAR